MKNLILITGLAGGILAASVALAADGDTNTPAATAAVGTNAGADQAAAGDQTPQPTDNTPQPVNADQAATPTAPALTAPVASTPMPAPLFKPRPLPPGEKGLLFNFHDVQLKQVLDYMSQAAGYVIHPLVDVSGTVTIWNDVPMSKDDGIAMLKQALQEHGYTAKVEGRILTVETLAAGRKDPEVGIGNMPDQIVSTSDMLTQIVPISTLNVVQLQKELQSVKSEDGLITADEAANALVITDTKKNIKHLMEIIHALDNINSSSAVVRVWPLKYADAKSTAALVKELFPGADAQAGNNRNTFPGFGARGGRGGGGGGGNPFAALMGGDTGGDSNGHTPTAKVNATSDDHSNALIVSGPESLIDTIDSLVKQLDLPVEDATVVETFHLHNADPGEMADLLGALFPDDSSTDATSRQVTFGRGAFGGFGGAGGGRAGGRGGAAAAPAESDRMKKMARVLAVPDKRTKSLVVTASKDVMPDIAAMINELDSRTDRKVSPHSIAINNADPAVVQQLLQEQFMSFSGSSGKGASSTLTTGISQLNDRTKSMSQYFNQNNSTTIGGSTSSGGRGGN